MRVEIETIDPVDDHVNVDVETIKSGSNTSNTTSNNGDPMSSLFWDNILDQDFSPRRLSVGDIFFDGNNGDACETDDYTLGWVEVVVTNKRSVYVSPIYSPRKPFIAKGLNDIPEAARQQEFVVSDSCRIPNRVKESIRGRHCWKWDESLANKAAALHRLRVRGVLVMHSYNVHGFQNGTSTRKHSHRCHKYKDTYLAKWCALGFGRSVFDDTDLRQIVSVSGVSHANDPETDPDEDSEIHVEHLDKPNPPPPSGEPDERILYLNLRRKAGTQSTDFRRDVEYSVETVLRERCPPDDSLISHLHHRIMKYLWYCEDGTHTYSDQYLCETSTFLAALLGCNTNVSPLGGTVQAINALFYLTGYLSKNPVKPTSWITCIIASLKSVYRTKSVAEDEGTPSRNAKFFLQKVLNRLNALAEITDTQAAMILLGHKSFQCSHRFAFCFQHEALEEQVRLHTEKTVDVNDGLSTVGSPSESVNSQPVEEDEDNFSLHSEDDGSSVRHIDQTPSTMFDSQVNDLHPDSDSGFSDSDNHTVVSPADNDSSVTEKEMFKDHNDQELGCETDVQETPNENIDLPTNGNMIYRDLDGVAHALSQHHHYKNRVRNWKSTLPCRGDNTHTQSDLLWWYYHARDNNDPSWRTYQREKGLHDFTLDEYVSHIQVVEMPESLPTSGSIRYYLFNQDYPISSSHIQKLRPKHYVTALSGHPPRCPGPKPERRGDESKSSHSKRVLRWQLKADFYGRTMGSILSPWNNRGDCGVHSYTDFQRLQEKWDTAFNDLYNDRSWRHYIHRDRSKEQLHTVYPNPNRFPDPRPAARRLHARNLGINLRVPKKMKRICNKWRYQHSDRFDSPEEYDYINSEPKGSDNDVQNALAIASLLETFSSKKSNSLNGIGEQTSVYLQNMRDQVEKLYKCDKRHQSTIPASHKLDPKWYKQPLTSDIKWAKETLKELMHREPDVTGDVSDDISGEYSSTDNELRAGLSPDQLLVFDHTIQCFDSNKPLRVFVHGGPGTGKSFLAKKLMKAATARGLLPRFTALSGAAATINGGTTIHYTVGMRKHVSWGSVPDKNQIKRIRNRNGTMRFLIIDEISMSHAQMWNQIKENLKAAHYWDMLHVVAMGDMCQLPPPNQFVKPLYTDFVLAAKKPTSYSTKPLVLAGIKSFQSLRKMELTTQNRAKSDSKHTKTITQLRKGRVNDEFLRQLIPLRDKDVKRGWRFVPILVTSNAEVIMLNNRQVIEFAKSRNQFVLKWTNPIRNCENADSYDPDVVESIVPEAVQCFCLGAPGFINANKNPVGTGIVNGYRVVQHSLIWKDHPWTPPEEGWLPGQVCC